MSPYKEYKSDLHTDIEFEDEKEKDVCECCEKNEKEKPFDLCNTCANDIKTMLAMPMYVQDYFIKQFGLGE